MRDKYTYHPIAAMAWFIVACFVLALCLSGCATPLLSITPAGITETGPQLLWGERHYAVAGPQGAAEVNVSKRTLGVVGGALGGAIIGAATGNPAAGAVVGTIAGGIGQALDRDSVTSPTLPAAWTPPKNAIQPATATNAPQEVSGATQARDSPANTKE